MVMLLIVPREELLKETAAILDRTKASRNLGTVLESIELCLGKGVGVGGMRPAVSFGDSQIGL